MTTTTTTRMTARASGLPAGLLVSVRNVDEAVEAVAGGAAIVDVKDPARGPLGRAAAGVAAAIAGAVGASVPWTMACGELAAGEAVIVRHVEEVLGMAATPPAAIKAGPSGLARPRWEEAYRRLSAAVPETVEVVAVAYADWRAATAPEPEAVIEAAAACGARSLLIDTFDKAAAGILEACGPEAIGRWVRRACDAGLQPALAGRLTGRGVAEAAALGARIVGVRTAACSGGRLGRVGRGHVAALVGTLAESRAAAAARARHSSLLADTEPEDVIP